MRLREPAAIKLDSESGCQKFNAITQAECALEANPTESDRVKRALVRVAEATDRCEMRLNEILPIVLEDEAAAFDRDMRLACASVIGVLEEFRQNMARTLDLFEKLVPWSSEFRIGFQLVPAG